MKLGDELELVSDDEEAEDAELNRILKEDSSPKQKAFDAFGVNNDEANQNDVNDIDIDSALQGLDETASDTPIIDESEVKDDKIISRKEEIGIKQQKSSISPVLVAVLFFVIVVAGVYYYITFFQDNDTPIVKENVQEQLNNTTAEQIEQRNPDNIDVVNEEQGEKLTTDEIKENEENQKKEIVAIIPTGRDNPFMPLGKYIQQPERIIDFDNVLSTKYSVDSICDMIISAIKEKAIWKTKSENARLLTKKEYSWEIISKLTISKYKKIIEKNRT